MITIFQITQRHVQNTTGLIFAAMRTSDLLQKCPCSDVKIFSYLKIKKYYWNCLAVEILVLFQYMIVYVENEVIRVFL
jgi:hypothetical protein